MVAILLSLAYFFVLVRGADGQCAEPLDRRYRSTGLVGAGGTAQTLIAPTGIAYAGGEAWSARSRHGKSSRAAPLRVVAVEGLELIVEPEEKGG